jgi:hypothetical protein
LDVTGDAYAMVADGSNGYDVDGASNGAEALVMSGPEFARVFHERHDRRAPVVVITAAADAHRLALDVDAEDWLGKRFNTGDLPCVVQRHIGTA